MGQHRRATARRAVECGCGWRGSRQPAHNNLPCPTCGGTVYVSARPKGRPPRERVRLQIWIPKLWHTALSPDVNGTVRQLIRAHLYGSADG